MKTVLSICKYCTTTLLFVLSSYYLKAQTKDETLKWIAEKINKYGQNVNAWQTDNESFTCDRIKIKHVSSHGLKGVNRPPMIICQYINMGDITNAVSTTDAAGVPYTKISLSKELVLRHIDPGRDDDGQIVDLDGKHYYFDALYLNWDGERDLLNRMAKAFTMLISFSSPKETF